MNLNISVAMRWGLSALILFTVILALYFGASIFIPTIISLLLAAMLWPLVTWLHKRGLPLPALCGRAGFPWVRPCLRRLRLPWAAACLSTVTGVVILTLLVAAGFALLVSKFVLDVGIEQKQKDMYGKFRDKVAVMTSPLIQDNDQYFNSDPDQSRIYKTIKSYFDPNQHAITDMLTAIGMTATSILWDAILILFTLLFLLIEGRMLSGHLVSIFGPSDEARRRALAALKDMATQIRAYLVWRTLINFSMAAFLGLMYWYLGLGQPWTWALLTAVLWYIPYIGPIIAGFPPVIDAFLNCPNPWTPVGILVFYTLFVMLEGYFVVPVVMGRSMELNATTVMLACIFWWLVWGVPGMFLALPLMAAIRTICMHVPGWHPWANLMGTREDPPPPKVEPGVVLAPAVADGYLTTRTS